MKKVIIAALLVAPAIFLTSCTVTEATYSPGYNNDYVYSVGYTGYSPYWNNYYSGGWGNVGYWRGYRGFHHGWGGRW